MEPEQNEQREEPSNIITTSVLQWVPIVKVFILCFGSVMCFFIAFANHNVTAYVPFISEMGAHVPESLIFSLSLYSGATAGSIIVLYRFLIMRYQLHLMDARLNKINRTSTIFGLVSMFGLVGVAAVPMSTILWVHLIFAGIHFFFALMYVNLQTFINYYVPGGNSIWNQLRMILCALLMLTMLSLVIFFPLSHFKWQRSNDIPPALKTPDDPYFALMLTSSILEWLLYGIFLAIMSSFFIEFRNFQLTFEIGLRQVPAPTDVPEE